jgi:hypothetical protein
MCYIFFSSPTPGRALCSILFFFFFFVDCNYCLEYISGSQSLFPAFIPLFLAPPQPAPGAIHQAERRDRQQRQEEKKNLSD